MVDSYRDLLSGSLDAYMSVVSNRLNDVMKQLTIIATVFLPLSFLTGFFGQNLGWLVAREGSLGAFLIFGIGTEALGRPGPALPVPPARVDVKPFSAERNVVRARPIRSSCSRLAGSGTANLCPVAEPSPVPPEPQPMLAPLTASAIFLVLTINPRRRGRLPGPAGRLVGPAAVGRLPRARRRPGLRRRDRLAGLGPPVRRAAPGRAAPVPRAHRGPAPRACHARGPAVPHPARADGPVLRVRLPGPDPAGRRGHGGRRDARVPVLRRA